MINQRQYSGSRRATISVVHAFSQLSPQRSNSLKTYKVFSTLSWKARKHPSDSLVKMIMTHWNNTALSLDSYILDSNPPQSDTMAKLSNTPTSTGIDRSVSILRFLMPKKRNTTRQNLTRTHISGQPRKAVVTIPVDFSATVDDVVRWVSATRGVKIF